MQYDMNAFIGLPSALSLPPARDRCAAFGVSFAAFDAGAAKAAARWLHVPIGPSSSMAVCMASI